LKHTGISAVMPVKNGEKYLIDSMQQLSKNLQENDEIVVVNDGSTDGTFSILKRWAQEDRRVNVVNNPNHGLTNALNLGFKESSNNWIARFDVDDKYSINRLRIQREAIRSKVILIFSDYENFSSDGVNLGTIPSAIFPSATALSLISSQRTAHPSALISKDAFNEAGGYQLEDFPAEDISLWLRMAKFGEIISVPKILLHYQISPNSVSVSRYSTAKSKTEELLRKFPISVIYLNDVLDNFKEYATLYGHEELATERVILMYRDIVQYSRTYGIDISLNNLKRSLQATINLLGQEALTKSILGLKQDSVKRNKSRFNS
jgi:glycosyltransferase involved in cell wall biosynthesis